MQREIRNRPDFPQNAHPAGRAGSSGVSDTVYHLAMRRRLVAVALTLLSFPMPDRDAPRPPARSIIGGRDDGGSCG